MLVLSRKRGERIRIGDDIEVTILAIAANRVNLGFSAPPDVWIHRDNMQTPGKPDGSAVDPPASSR